MLKVLVIKPSSLGDIIHCAEAVESIARARLDCRVSWVVNSEYADFVRELPGVFDALAFPRSRFRLSRFPFWLPEAASWFVSLRQGFDVAVDFQGLQRSGLMALWSGAQERFGFREAREASWIYYNRPVEVPRSLCHAGDKVNYLASQVLERSDLLSSASRAQTVPGTSENGERFRITVPNAVHEAVRSVLGDVRGPILALCPGSRWASKRWPTARWVELLGLLAKAHSDVHPVFLGAPDERAEIEAIIGEARVPADCLAGRVDLWQTAAVLESAVAAVTMDSAPLHLAVAVGTPTVSLFGPTDPERVGPRGEEHRILRKDLDCLGCYERECPLERRVCLPEVDAREVLEAVESTFQSITPKITQ